MLMLNNKLCLTSVMEFLRRGRVDHGTGGGKVVVVVDLSKRKVTTYFTPKSSTTRVNCTGRHLCLQSPGTNLLWW